MSNLVSIQFQPTGYSHNVYTGITSGVTNGIVCSAQTISCSFTVDNTYKESYDTIWLSISTDEGCKEQLYEIFVNTPNCDGEYCEFSATTVYNGLINDCDLEITVSSTNITAFGGTGSATVTYTKNHGPVTILWNNGQTGQTISGISGGTYTVSVTDTSISGCTVTGSTTVYEEMIFSASSINAFTRINLESYTSPITMVWGDGSEETYTAVTTGSTAISHTYSSPYTGLVKMKSIDLSDVERFDISAATPTTNAYTVNTSEARKLDKTRLYITRGNGKTIGLVSQLPGTLSPSGLTLTINNAFITGGTQDLPRNLTDGRFYDGIKMSGNTSNFPTGLTAIDVSGFNTIEGSVASYPKTVTISRIYGDNTISGFTQDLPTGMTSFGLGGNTTLKGDVDNLPKNLNFCYIYGQNSVSGNTSSFTGMPLNTLVIANDEGYATSGNTITGQLSSIPKGVRTLHIEGSNTISGNTTDAPTGITYLNLRGTGVVSGYIGSLPNTLTDLFISGENTISGNTLNIPPNISVFELAGNNTLTGSLNDIPANIYYFILKGESTVTGYTAGRTWGTTSGVMSRFTHVPTIPGNRLTTGSTDSLLIDFTGSTWPYSTRFGTPRINILGSGTTASDAAKVILSGYGINIIFEP